MPTISQLHARQILDSRGNPTIEVDVTLADGTVGRAAVPSGASTGAREARELRDQSSEYLGKSVTMAVQHVHTEIAQALTSIDLDQAALDKKMIELDGTPTKSRLGANAILGVSLGFAAATAHSKKIPLFKYIGELAGVTYFSLPKPILNILNGGAHANWTTDIQEYMVFPMKSESYHEHLRKSVEVFQHLGKLLAKKGLSTNVGNEGGYAPEFQSNEQAFELILEAIANAGYTTGVEGDFMLGIDAAATEFYENGVYHLKRDNTTKNSPQMIEWMEELCTKYPLISIEDPLADDDWNGWAELTARLGTQVQVVGDDLTVTNPTYTQQAISGKNCNAMIIKLNQIGSLTETLEALRLVKQAGWKSIISHRSGETEDTFIAHLAVGAAGNQIKSGAPSRTDRTAKYNELLRIEEQLNVT